METYLLIIAEFFKTGLFSIGGGLATLPFLYDLSHKYQWFTEAELANMIAVAESTPGPIGINMSTYAGFNASGILGALAATTSLVAPSIIVIILVAKILDRFKENKMIDAVFYTLRPAVTGLIAASCFQLMASTLFTLDKAALQSFAALFHIKELILFFILLFLTNKWKKHPIVYLGIAAFCGILFQFS